MKDESLVLTQPEALTPVELLRIAVTQGADVDKLGKLMELQERWEKNEARKAFTAALKTFKAHPPIVPKNKHVVFQTSKGETNYWHTTLDKACEVIGVELTKHKISHRWVTAQEGDWISVTCILTHELGHSEQTTLKGAPDLTGSKNSVQAIGSTVTYLQRYTLLAATGLAAENTDNDAQSLNRPDPMPDERLVECQDWITNSQNEAELQKMFVIGYKEARDLGDRDAMASLIALKDKKKKELKCQR